jgi:hypothetical protein
MTEHGKQYFLDELAKLKLETLKTWAEASDASEWSGPEMGLLSRSDLPSGIDNLLEALNKVANECGVVRTSPS